MKFKIFVSYSDFDKSKVDLIVNELSGHNNFEPLVIASNRDALESLSSKVKDGINRAVVFVPILTRKSISTQWINQEIGFAVAKEKVIMPIIEENLFDELKGFINKQVDLPYVFMKSTNNGQENKNFMKQFRFLLSDLEELV